MAFFWHWMVVLEEDGGDVFFHGESTGVLGVVVGVVTVAAVITAVAVERFVTFPIELVAVVSTLMYLSTSADVRV